MAEPNLLLTKLTELQNHEDFQIVWFSLDTNIPTQLQNINDYLTIYHTFSDSDNHIKNIQSDRKILLVLVDLFEHALYFNRLRQIQSIYVLEKNPLNIHYPKEKYPKLMGIFSDEQVLIERVRRDIILSFRNDLLIQISSLTEISIQQTFTSNNETKLAFLWNQLFIYYLTNPINTNMNKLKDEMIKQCRLEYKDNPNGLKDIDKFENDCTYDTVLNWYTRDSFVYRLVNRAFRTRNIDLIRKFQYFIILFYDKLKELSIKQQKPNYTKVYRGQTMKVNELEKLKTNKECLMSINTIMSTTHAKTVADMFGPEDESDIRLLLAEDKVSIIFEIDLSNANNTTVFPFADISSYGLNDSEEEMLFFPGSIFRIDSIEQENSSRWNIKLTLKNQTLEQVENVMNIFQNQLYHLTHSREIFMKTDDFHLYKQYHRILTNKKLELIDLFTTHKEINLNYLFKNLFNREKLIEYYKSVLLNENFIDQTKFLIFNILIGNNYYHLCQYDNALLHYGITFSLLDEHNQLTGELYHHIGDVWTSMTNFQNALTCYQQAVKILHNYDVKSRYLARIYRKISSICRKQNNHDDADVYEQLAKEIDIDPNERSDLIDENSLEYYQSQLKHTPNLSIDQRVNILHSIGVYFIKERNYSRALENLLQEKQLLTDNLSLNKCFAEKLVLVCECIAWHHFIENDKLKALITWKNTIDIRSSFLSLKTNLPS